MVKSNEQSASQSILGPIEEKLSSLSITIENLATKDDIQNFLTIVEANLEKELLERDKKIFELEEKINIINNQRIDDLEYSKRLNEKLVNLENGLTEWKNKFENQIQEISANMPEDESDDDDDDDGHDSENNLQPLDLLIVSDSICKHVDTNLVNPGKPSKLICRPGAKIPEIKEALIGVQSQYQVSKLVIHAMTNHIPNETPNEISEKMLNFIDEVRQNMPKTQIFVSLVLPKYDNSFLEGINYLNYQICEASSNAGYNVIQHPYFASRGNVNTDLLARDGLHLSRLGVKQIGMDIKRALER